MTTKLVFDCETDGFLDKLTTIHSLVVRDVDTGEVGSFADQPGYAPIRDGLDWLMKADEIIGHNIIKFDVPAIQKVYPDFNPKARTLDTLVLSRLFWPDLMDTDQALVKRGVLPPKLRGRYSLEAFGVRLGEWKGDYAEEMKAKGLDPWARWNKEMQDYCVQDVVVNYELYQRAVKVWKGEDKRGLGVPYSDRSVWLEMDVARIIARQEAWGFGFDVRAAEKLYVQLVAEREKLSAQLKETFRPWYASDGIVTVPKTRRLNRKDLPPVGFKTKRSGEQEPIHVKELYEEGSVYTKIKKVEFNPASGHHIADRLKRLFNWKPQEFTPSGDAKTDEKTLVTLPWPEVKLLTRYMTVAKRIGQLAEGTQAWLKKERNGRIYGSVQTVGAVTRRMTHSNPNVAQVPASKSLYGAECRELFTASEGFTLVGCDADALELRCLAGYMAPFDGGDYIRTVLEGNKDLGTDMHSVNARALGLDPKKTYKAGGKEQSGRDIAKTWF